MSYTNNEKPLYRTVSSQYNDFSGNGVFLLLYTNYPLTAPAVIPSMK